jgi:hypothetical protein
MNVIIFHKYFYISFQLHFCFNFLSQKAGSGSSSGSSKQRAWIRKHLHTLSALRAGYLFQVVHARADEEGLQAAVLPQQDIRVRPVHTHKHAKIKPGEDPY